MPLLTFAVPTYNRVECLRLLLERIDEEAAETWSTPAPVEVLVCDNASEDGTRAFLEPLAAQGRIRWLRHPANLGLDANILACLREARGRHVWICGDDDLPLPGALSRVARFLHERQPAMLYLPARWHEGDLALVDAPPAPAPEPVPVDAAEMAWRANTYMTFISSWVLDRERYFALASPGTAGRYGGTSLGQLEWHLTLLAGGGPLYAAAGPWMLARAGNTGGYALFDTFIPRYLRILREKLAQQPALLDFFSQHLLRAYLPGLVWALRIGKLGRFDEVDWNRVEGMLKEAWPAQPQRRSWPGRIAHWPRPLAKLAMGLCWLDARLWMKKMHGARRVQ